MTIFGRTGPISVALVAGFALAIWFSARAGEFEAAAKPIPVTAENFVRAESSRYLSAVVREGGFARLIHNRVPPPIERQSAARLNRDTLYSAAVFDLDAGPVRITIPDPGARFVSMQWINEDQFTQGG
jgi:hypothetical protein